MALQAKIALLDANHVEHMDARLQVCDLNPVRKCFRKF